MALFSSPKIKTMQNHKSNLVLAAFVSVSLFLIACSSASAPATPTPVDPATSNPTTSTNNITSAPKTEVITEAQVKSDSEIAAKALDTDNIKSCDAIKLTNLKSQCRYNIVASNAYKKSDPKLCEELTDQLEIENCKSNISPEYTP